MKGLARKILKFGMVCVYRVFLSPLFRVFCPASIGRYLRKELGVGLGVGAYNAFSGAGFSSRAMRFLPPAAREWCRRTYHVRFRSWLRERLPVSLRRMMFIDLDRRFDGGSRGAGGPSMENGGYLPVPDLGRLFTVLPQEESLILAFLKNEFASRLDPAARPVPSGSEACAAFLRETFFLRHLPRSLESVLAFGPLPPDLPYRIALATSSRVTALSAGTEGSLGHPRLRVLWEESSWEEAGRSAPFSAVVAGGGGAAFDGERCFRLLGAGGLLLLSWVPSGGSLKELRKVLEGRFTAKECATVVRDGPERWRWIEGEVESLAPGGFFLYCGLRK